MHSSAFFPATGEPSVIDLSARDAIPLSDPAEHGRSLRQAAYLTIGMGIAHALLFLLAIWLLASVPGPRAADADITTFYASPNRRRLILAGLYVMPFAGIAFMWFVVALRMWLSGNVRREQVLFSNILLYSGILYVALFFVAAAANSALAASAEFSRTAIDPMLARQLPQYGATLLLVFAMRMAAIFVFSTSNIGRTTSVLPKWFVYTGYGVGLFLLLSATFSPFLVLVFPVWLLTLCSFLLWRTRQIPADAVVVQPIGP
jgi:hypothetical protein